MNLEREEDTVTFMLKDSGSGKHVYTLHTDENNQFQFDNDDEGEEIIESDPAVADYLAKRIKLECSDTTDEDEDEDMIESIIPEDNCTEEAYEDEEQIVEDGEIVIQHSNGIEEELVYNTIEVGNNDESDEGSNDNINMNDVLTQHMDIREPLSALKLLLEERLGINLSDYQFWLQDQQMLESHKNLVDQCVQGEGLVQVNVQINKAQSKINIVDVLKPAEDYSEPLSGSIQEDADEPEEVETPSVQPVTTKQNVVRWIVDTNFKKDQERLKIPTDPNDWTVLHVRHWLQWAVRTFNLSRINLADWNINGRMLCQLTLVDFQSKVRSDPGDIFWTHLELLRKCKFVAVVQKTPESINYIAHPESHIRGRGVRSAKVTKLAKHQRNLLMDPTAPIILGGVGNRTGNNGQIQLWQFLLELLTDKNHTNVISWISNDGEFKLKNPEMVAQLWGIRKNKPTMNYEKLSRALRYYYDGDMISKVNGKRFVYKFVCDMRQLMGYSASELNRLVTEYALKEANMTICLDEDSYKAF